LTGIAARCEDAEVRSPRKARLEARGILVAVSAAAMLAPVGPQVFGAQQPRQVTSRTMVVATDGHRGASGSVRHPLATVREAVRRLPDGGVIELRGGRYSQRILLRHVSGITVRPYHREHVVLDGSGLTVPVGTSAMVRIDGSSRIAVKGLEITGYSTTRLHATPVGVYVDGASSHITVRGNHVHSMGNYNQTLGSFELNAHGIAVYGDRAHHPISDLRITRNQVDHLALGASESVVVNGNVDGWRISRNRIHDNNNIGIDAIGFEPTVPTAYRYTRVNRARNGVIADNTVYNIVSRGNPAYYEGGGWCNCADGIYIDGGTHIRVVRNRVSRADIGIEVAAENPRGAADHVSVADNFVRGSAFVGITTGGYCDGHRGCGGVRTGRSFANRFVNNTLYDNNALDDGSPELLIQYYAFRNAFENNVLYAANHGHALLGTVVGADNDGLSRRNRIDHNVYYARGARPSHATFGSLGHNYTGWRVYRRATGLDRHSTYVRPGLRAPARGNLHLRRQSPAVNAGAHLARYVTGPLDIDREPRVRGGRIDVGADERR
jgi:hypothetical protein